MSSFSSSYGSFSSPLSCNREYRCNDSSAEPYLSPTLGGDTSYLYENQFMLDLRDRHFPSPPATIPLRDYLHANPNILTKSSCSSLSFDSYSSGRPVSYPWEVSIVNPLPRPFASGGMSPIDIVEEPDQDPVLCSGSAPSDQEDGPGTHYIAPSF